jgi:hypothetical protein
MAHGVCELIWIRNILGDLGIEYTEPINLYYDNKTTITIAQNPVQHDCTKHVEVDHHFIKENMEKSYNFYLYNLRVN